MMISSQIIRFALIGGIGFLVDALLFLICVYLLNFDLFSARIIAFVCAATTTWYGNRIYTFGNTEQKTNGQWLKSLTSASISAIPNFVVFKLVINLNQGNQSNVWPFVALVLGVLVGMVSNYLFSKFWVFSSNELASVKMTRQLTD